jgi:long-chain acyl-CoA synthetase
MARFKCCNAARSVPAGEIDAKGRIRITDRKKDIIVNDKGDHVAPQKVEGMRTLQNGIAQAMVAAVERVNKDLSVTERIRRFIIADEPFTIENQQLTPSLKIRRHVLKDVYGERLDALYRG